MTLRAERQRRLHREAELNGHVKKWVYDGLRLAPLPCVPGASIRDVLQCEADRPLRGGEHGLRNGQPTRIPRSVEILVRLALALAAVRQALGLCEPTEG